ncbi:MAG: hypothetical protein ACRDOO_15360 [Actinomadura sp.]
MIPRKNERTSKRLAGISPWTWIAASMMAGGLAMVAAPAQAATTANTPASVVSDGGFGGGFGGIGGIGGIGGNDRRGDEIVDLMSIWQADD